jgi:hypothetical protein
MTNPAVRLVLWLAAGHALAGAAYTALINVPESSVPMLALSLVLASLALVLTAVTDGAAVRVLASGGDVWHAAAQARGDVGWLVAAGIVFVLFWSLGGRIDAWHAAHRGEIDAWLIASAGMTRSGWLHQALDGAVFLLRGVLGVSAAVAAFVAGARRGFAGIARLGWLRLAVSREQFGLTALAVILLIALPLRALFWRPLGLPPNWIETVVAGSKLLLIYLVLNLGWLLVLLAGVRAAHQREKQSPAAA